MYFFLFFSYLSMNAFFCSSFVWLNDESDRKDTWTFIIIIFIYCELHWKCKRLSFIQNEKKKGRNTTCNGMKAIELNFIAKQSVATMKKTEFTPNCIELNWIKNIVTTMSTLKVCNVRESFTPMTTKVYNCLHLL